MENAIQDTGQNSEIYKAVQSLRKDSPLRQIAEKLTANPNGLIEDISPIVIPFERRSADRTPDQKVAAWVIKSASLSEEQRTQLSAKLSSLVDDVDPRYISTPWAIVCILGGLLFLTFLASMGSSRWFLLSVMGSLPLIALPMYGANWNQKCRMQQTLRMLSILGDLGDPVGLASVATSVKYDDLRDRAVSALTKITANLRQEHYGTLPMQTIPVLCEILSLADNFTKLVILRALSIIGDGRAIRAVEQLSLRPPTPELGAAALALLAVLKQRDLDSKATRQLLRPSDASATGKLELLRGMSTGTDEDAALLVRASAAAAKEAI